MCAGNTQILHLGERVESRDLPHDDAVEGSGGKRRLDLSLTEPGMSEWSSVAPKIADSTENGLGRSA
jgi:hypothetical protein